MSSDQRTVAGGQCTLLTLFVALTVAGMLLGIAIRIGWNSSLLALAATLAVVLVASFWGVCWRLAPEATKTFSVFGVLALVVLAPLPSALLQSREAARRQQNSYNIHMLYRKVSALGEFDSRRDDWTQLSWVLWADTHATPSHHEP